MAIPLRPLALLAVLVLFGGAVAQTVNRIDLQRPDAPELAAPPGQAPARGAP